jgi:hypothetical protein
MKPQLVPLLFLLIACSVVPYVPITRSDAYAGWLLPGNFAIYRATNATLPGLGLEYGSKPQDGSSYVQMNYFIYSWKALNVSGSDATISVNVGGQEVIPPNRAYPQGTTKLLNESAIVKVNIDSLETSNSEGNAIGLWNFWIDPSMYSLTNYTTVAFTDTWEGAKLTALIGSCGPNPPAIKTGAGTFYTYICKSVPPTLVSGFGATIVVTDDYDTNVGLMLSAEIGALDDILYSSFQITRWFGSSLVLNSTNVDLHQVINRSSTIQSVGWELYVVPPVVIALGFASFWFVWRTKHRHPLPAA